MLSSEAIDEVEEYNKVSENKIAAVTRTEFGKGAARRARRAGLVPAVLYGHGTDPVHVALPGHEVLLALRTANALLTLSIDGGKDQLALPKQVQRNPVKGDIEHIDLVIVRRGEKVTVEVPLIVINEEKVDGVITMDQQTIALEAEATNIPASVEIDVEGMQIGQHIAAKDLTLPAGAVFNGEPDDLILSIAALRVEEPAVTEGDAEAEAGTAAEETATEEA
ncbi:MAG: 50S ribosomal protein L25/general stress protein Ctc [Propionicimonas sp.]|uniref:50S ribosomal protein L25/general stress protein Ctc n=1 Tax=Propionicimonas sp. TaxID=1955623 RepID=UPI002B200357|nr:50S ribosomal protein L25/general stress protein Ctc [Propionicimonas sp.]MEA4943469.1 50S ribosomal protein L25/general stress protein Ctc [Propionicimonas sp.]MEA5054613.1 50S ribosomal protein L25/general stress protein Ctc [Propionicimonas sp.]MEA5119525.1 50S ribosomal protein L25/general stress protein Ctc [Propionicimonas sp.]